jgi:hypothetical protein
MFTRQEAIPDRTVLSCGAAGVASFKAFMNSISQQYGMVFTDNSGATEAELRTIYPKGIVPHPTLNIDADRDRDFSFVIRPNRFLT